MTVKTTFDILDYSALVELIADGYFDENGEYQPHMGRINTMMLFYEHCLEDANIVDKPVADLTVDDMNLIISDGNFQKAYCDALYGINNRLPDKEYLHCENLSFEYAVSDANEIIEARKSSAGQFGIIIQNALTKLGEVLAGSLNDEMIQNIAKIAESASDNGNLAEALVREYINSGRLEEIVQKQKVSPAKKQTQKKTTTKTSKAKSSVVPMKK